MLRLGLERQRQTLGLWSQDELRQHYQLLIKDYPRTTSELSRWPGDKTVELRRQAVRFEDQWLIVSVLRGVTARQAAEHRIQQLYAAVNQAPDAIFVIDPDTMTYVDANEPGARMYGTTRDDLLDTDVESLNKHLALYPEGTMRDRLRDLIRQAPAHTVENLTLTFPDGRRTVVETTRRAMQVDGKWMVLVMSRDVTEREKANQALTAHVAELARSNRELAQFANVTSHDLSEPLRMDDALGNLAHAMRDSGAVIERATALPTLWYERTSMTQVFQNLVSNALKFKRSNPVVVRISAQRSEDCWTISVMDNGIGVDPDYFERIFVIFQRLHSRAEYEGTGIGLAICEKIVERHGGRIWAEAAPGGGACFKFTLPVQPVAMAS